REARDAEPRQEREPRPEADLDRRLGEGIARPRDLAPGEHGGAETGGEGERVARPLLRRADDRAHDDRRRRGKGGERPPAGTAAPVDGERRQAFDLEPRREGREHPEARAGEEREAQGVHQTRRQPKRYSSRRKRSASGAFGMRSAAASHSISTPARIATFPSSAASVNGPA